jgi:hypothetical protein
MKARIFSYFDLKFVLKIYSIFDYTNYESMYCISGEGWRARVREIFWLV